MGLELEYKHSYLLMHLNNFETLRNPRGNGTYACGNNCDYIYIVQECGMLMSANKCPWCGADIGGANHQHIIRPGHIRLNDSDAKKLLENLVAKYENNHKRGYYNVTTHSEDANLAYSGIRPISWRLLRTFVHNSLYFFITVGGSSENEFRQILN